MWLTAKYLKVALQAFDVRGSQEFESAFAEMAKRRIAASGFSEFVEAVGLMGYGPDMSALFRRAATYVDKILKGTKPSDLPVEQSMKFDFIISLKTAK